jgi:hypothetical protein
MISITEPYMIFVTVRFHYGVEPSCNAIRVSKHCGMALERAGYVPEKSPSMQFVSKSLKCQEWLLENQV